VRLETCLGQDQLVRDILGAVGLALLSPEYTYKSGFRGQAVVQENDVRSLLRFLLMVLLNCLSTQEIL
jgi:hypothetical protein